MNSPVSLFWALVLLPWFSPLRAEEVKVTGVNGLVYYGAGNAAPTVPVKVGQHLGAGTFSAAADGVLYISAYEGTELRLSEAGTLRYDGGDTICVMQHLDGKRSTFHLLQGKVQIDVEAGAANRHCYHVILPADETSVAQGECVMCMHGSSTFLFVAKGRALVVDTESKDSPNPLVAKGTPTYGALPATGRTDVTSMLKLPPKPEILVGNGNVEILSSQGDIRVASLSALSAGTQNCLLSGFDDNVIETKKKNANPDDSTSTNSPFFHSDIVSPTQ